MKLRAKYLFLYLLSFDFPSNLVNQSILIERLNILIILSFLFENFTHEHRVYIIPTPGLLGFLPCPPPHNSPPKFMTSSLLLLHLYLSLSV